MTSKAATSGTRRTPDCQCALAPTSSSSSGIVIVGSTASLSEQQQMNFKLKGKCANTWMS